MDIDINKLSNEEKAAVVCLYYARSESDDPDYKGVHAKLRTVAQKYGLKYTTLKHNKDRYDANFDTGRVGWHQKSLKGQSHFLYDIYEKYKEYPLDDMKVAVSQIIEKAEEEGDLYFSIKTKDPEAVQKIFGKKKNIELEGLNVLQDSLKKGQLIFIVLGGDKPQWDTGLIGIGLLSKEPYDKGYDKKNKKNYKVKVDIKLILKTPIKREDLVPYQDTYGIIGIAPITKWEPNQALSQISEEKAIALMRAMLEIQPSIEKELSSLVDEDTMKRIKGAATVFVPVEVNYKENISQGIKELQEVADEEDIDESLEEDEEYTEEDFLDEAYISETDYNTLCELLENKKNVILQGAPGTGKTFLAKRLAYSIIGYKSKRCVKLVQFHQSYSYEDFVIGYRPDKDGFKLTAGPFYNFCKEALKHKNTDFFFIIDEINRGNLSKIFGELLMLIEADKRDEEIILLYENKKFSVPPNVYIIGMMNTADRSLALMDYALRRRFSFFEINPAFDSKGFQRDIAAYSKTKINKLIKVIKELNQTITDDETLGKGFMIGHSYFSTEQPITNTYLKSVIDYDIVPLLSEYWFDEPSHVEEWSDKLHGALK